MTREPGDMFDHDQRPTADNPIGGPKRSTIKPLVATVGLFVVLGILYWLGTFLINAK